MKNNTKTFLVIIILVILGIVIYYRTTHKEASPEDETPLVKEEKKVSISTKDIKEENYSGKISVIAGDKQVATKAREYIDAEVAAFKKTADAQVPDMRKEFGIDSPTANYGLFLEAQYLDGEETESIVISQYTYTGGANGNSSFQVFTADSKNDKILTLSDVIRKDKQVAFTDLIKTELKSWKTKESEPMGVFEDAVDMLTFDSFRNWSMDGENLTIYFDKYEIGPGVIGAIAFPIPLDKITNYLYK